MSDPKTLGIAAMTVRVVVGLLCLVPALLLALHPKAPRAFAEMGSPDWVRVALAWGEVAAATLFLIPGATFVGAGALLAVLITAVGLHLAVGDMPWNLVAYMAGIGFVLWHHKSTNTPEDSTCMTTSS